jgi:hypothetical protein
MELSWKDDRGEKRKQTPSDAASAAAFSEGGRSLILTTFLDANNFFFASLYVLGSTITAHLNCPSGRLLDRTSQALAEGLGLIPIESSQGAPDRSFVDDELWAQVAHLVRGREWAQVASQTAIFVENRVRELANRPLDEIGDRLMKTVFDPDGDVFPLGETGGERQGWHRFAMGFTLALRKVDTHRIQNRSDLKRYAFGVLGSGSLLLTQLRHQCADELCGSTSGVTAEN